MLDATKIKREQRRNQRYKNNYTTSNVALIHTRCEQRRARLERETLLTDSYQWISIRTFVVGRIRLAARQNIGSMSYQSNTDCMNSSFEVHCMLSVLTQGLTFIKEIATCQFEIQTLRLQVP